jgi:hypothetical protein
VVRKVWEGWYCVGSEGVRGGGRGAVNREEGSFGP